MHEENRARPLQAAVVSAASFASLGVVPIFALLVAPEALRAPAIAVVSLVTLTALGALGGWLGGAPKARAAIRVVVGGGAAMAATSLIGHLLGVAGLGSGIGHEVDAVAEAALGAGQEQPGRYGKVAFRPAR